MTKTPPATMLEVSGLVEMPFIVLALAGYFLRRRQPPATPPPPASGLPGDEGPRPTV